MCQKLNCWNLLQCVYRVAVQLVLERSHFYLNIFYHIKKDVFLYSFVLHGDEWSAINYYIHFLKESKWNVSDNCVTEEPAKCELKLRSWGSEHTLCFSSTMFYFINIFRNSWKTIYVLLYVFRVHSYYTIIMLLCADNIAQFIMFFLNTHEFE